VTDPTSTTFERVECGLSGGHDWWCMLRPGHSDRCIPRSSETPAPALPPASVASPATSDDPHTGLVIEPYRDDRNRPRWVFRCWGTDTCDGALSLDHSSEQSAQSARDRHIAEAHAEQQRLWADACASVRPAEPQATLEDHISGGNPTNRIGLLASIDPAPAPDSALRDAIAGALPALSEAGITRAVRAVEAHTAQLRAARDEARAEAKADRIHHARIGADLDRMSERAEQAEAELVGVRSTLDRVREVHRPTNVYASACAGEPPDCAAGCGDFPCPTITALDPKACCERPVHVPRRRDPRLRGRRHPHRTAHRQPQPTRTPHHRRWTGGPAMTDEEGEYELVLPFVICKSDGGPYDDQAFVAGVNCGQLMAELQALTQHSALPRPRYARPEYLPQYDLIAMQHGYLIRHGAIDEPSGFQRIDFEHGDTATPRED